MLRGFKRVTCPHCGHSFLAAEMEDNATIAEMPVHCPKCGRVVKTNWWLNLLTRLFGKAHL